MKIPWQPLVFCHRQRSALVVTKSIRFQPHIEATGASAFARSSGEGRLGMHLSSIYRVIYRLISMHCQLSKKLSDGKSHLHHNSDYCWSLVGDQHWPININWKEAAVSHRQGRNLSTPPTRRSTSADQPDPHGFESVHSSG